MPKQPIGLLPIATTKPETATLTSAELVAEYSEAQLAALPGYRRLDPDASGAAFEGQWELLLDAVTAVLAQDKLPDTSDAALALIGSQFSDQATVRGDRATILCQVRCS